jgi:hypothetical protein
MTPNALEKGRRLGVISRKRKAHEFAVQMSPVINNFQEQGLTLSKIAVELNDRDFLTSSGKTGCWSPTTVRSVIMRINESMAVAL